MALELRGSVAEEIVKIAEKVGMDPETYLRHVLAKVKRKKKKIEYLPLKGKAEIAKTVARYGLSFFKNPAIIWSGGKDSTLVLWFAKLAAEELGKKIGDYKVLLIDHFMHFEETFEFMDKVAEDWGFKWEAVGTEELKGYKYGEEVEVASLPEELRKELEKIGYNKPTFPFALNNIAGNHLLKTVALKRAIARMKLDAVFIGIRWDENPARADETFFSPREEPRHFRVHPILLFTERDVWDYTLRNKLPIHPLYKKGYRSLDDKYETKKVSDKPAWEQDLETTEERFGRAQDKEQIMELLRKFGYM